MNAPKTASARTPHPRGRREPKWRIAAVVLLVVALLASIAIGALLNRPDQAQKPAQPEPAQAGPAQLALGNLAKAQDVAAEREGRFSAYWMKRGDRRIERVAGPVAAPGVTDLRAIACADGWVAAAVVGNSAFLSSNRQRNAATHADDLDRPACITRSAVDSMLADLGLAAPYPRPDASRFARRSGDAGYRPAFHVSPQKNWMNDPQRPFFHDGLWHFYYLYNADFPKGNGTEWYHLTSSDLVSWHDEGVAIRKFTNGLGDIETGSAVVDTENTAGFGRDAVIAIMTQQHEGVQRQSLFVSKDGGYSFASYEGNPVMDNPGQEHWRDPKIIRDAAHDQWLMVLAEGHKLGFYTSKDLKQWTYVSGFVRDGLGVLECPDLFQLDLDGNPEKRTWVLAAGANGGAEGMTTGTVYWTGNWDGKTFTPAGERHQWIDTGSDFYAAVSWDDPRLTEDQRMASRHMIGWMNNWAYAGKLPTPDWHGGADTIVRDIRLASVDGRPTIVSQPTRALASLEGEPTTLAAQTLTEANTTLPLKAQGAYRIDLTVRKREADDGNEARIKIKGNGDRFVTVGYNFADQLAFVVRDNDAIASGLADLGPAYRDVRTARSPARDGSVTLTVFVDYSSVEVFVNDGERTMTSLIFPHPGAETISASTAKGRLELSSLRYTPLASTGR